MERFRMKKPLRLQTWITILVCAVLLLSLSVTGLLIAKVTAENTEERLAEKVMDIARTVSRSQLVINGLTEQTDSREIQAYTKAVQQDTGVQYIVVMNMDHIRQSHPIEQRIGEGFVGNDEDRAFLGESYTSVAEGTLGTSMRAFVPINNGDTQVGVVAVGILLDHIERAIWSNQRIVYTGIAIGILVGVVGAVLLARKVKRTLFGLEPQEIAKVLQERDAILASAREGIIATNEQAEIVVANPAAMKIFQRAGIKGNPIGHSVVTYLPESDLKQGLLQQKEVHDQEQKLNGIDIVVNSFSLHIHDRKTGSIATFRDKTEMASLIAQLTGTKHYAETLRAQSHEFMNKLQVISAMVHTESYEELKEYIRYVSNHYHEEVGSVSRLVKDPVLAGYLLTTCSKLREKGVDVKVEGDHSLPIVKHSKQIDVITTVIANVINNAYEAIAEQLEKKVVIRLNYYEGQLYVSIQDNGEGLSETEQEEMLKKGRSTKGEHRGYGLYLTKKALDKVGGCMEVSSTQGKGTTFYIIIPYEGEKND